MEALLGDWLGVSCLVGWWATAFICTTCLSWVLFSSLFGCSFLCVFFPYNFLKFLFNYQTVFISTHKFLSHFYPFDCPPSSHDGGSRQAAVWYLVPPP